MGLFKNLFAKKIPTPLPATLKYTCYGIKYFNPKADATDEIRELYYAKFKELNRVYANEDLDQMSDKCSMNVRECFYWFPDKRPDSTSIRIKYKFMGVNEGIDPEIKSKIEFAFSELRPLTRVDIQKVKQALQFEIFNNCNFLTITEATIVVDGIEEVYYFRQTPSTF